MNAPAQPAPVPRHLAIIMDGNGRWAQQRHRPRLVGHRAGARAVRRCVAFCLQRGIQALTLFAFSSENWNRPQEEVSGLMKLFLRALEREVDTLHQQQVQVRFIGARDRFDPAIRARMQAAEALTASNTRLVLSIAASYGGRQDITAAARALAVEVAAGRLRPEQIDEERLGAHMALADLPAPDLFIRTGGELRISNFLLWQLAYTELWFTPTLWPDVDAAVLDQALADYARRERRFGLTTDQIRSLALEPRP
ncbi:MAG: di-trans,poly-cis-decaprenylcistransferase [Thermomonas hydrothermalis]|uniref:polyprenyl diphosphate synthase n=1 Tax=Thermomonas hydrothermalis TaxID=213588 RepID=UPI00235402E8|nr:polyprenyl diphosphate synthase [Thermomonas hydrothermalis]MCL6619914.1 di-trans,poly-cis-decaprenylcistransferase [Thermomonas hydrothermalis]